MTSTKEIEVTIKQHRKEKQKPLVVEFFFIIKGEAGRFAQRAGALQLCRTESSSPPPSSTIPQSLVWSPTTMARSSAPTSSTSAFHAWNHQ